MKFVGIIIFLFAILELVLTIKIKRENQKPVDILTQIRLSRSKKSLLKSEMRNQKDVKKWQALNATYTATKEHLKALRLKFAIKEPLQA